MGATSARQYACNLCGKLELSDNGNLPAEWQASKDERVTACGSCVAAVLRDSVDALVGGVSAACRASLGRAGESGSCGMITGIWALMIAHHMLQHDIFRLEQEMHLAAAQESDVARAADARERAGE